MSNEKTHPGILANLHHLWSRVEDACAVVAAGLIAAAMVLTVVEVISRKLFNAPLPGMIDMFDLGMAAVAFLGASQCQRMGGHVRMELIVRRLKGRTLWAVEALTTLVAFGFILSLAFASAEGVARAYQVGDATMDLLLPVWPAKTLITIALTVLMVRLALQLLDSVRLSLSPDAQPITALSVASVAEHAREEIDDAISRLEADDSRNDRGDR